MGSHDDWRLALCALWQVQPCLALETGAGEVQDPPAVCGCVLRLVRRCAGDIVQHGAWDKADVPAEDGSGA